MTVEHIENSIKKALAGESNIDESVLSIRGFSTPTIRHLFNNLCNIKEGNYLEVGLFCGATFCSSFNKDTVSIGIENFSQDFSVGFEKVRQELEGNIGVNGHKAKNYCVFDCDCFGISRLAYPFPIHIYFYDGHHDEQYQAKALPQFIDNMADKFIFVIDDTNWESVRNGTIKGFETLADKIDIEKFWVLRGVAGHEDPIWHNGVNIYLINKK